MTTPPQDAEPTSADHAARCHAALEAYNDARDVRSNLIDPLRDARPDQAKVDSMPTTSLLAIC